MKLLRVVPARSRRLIVTGAIAFTVLWLAPWAVLQISGTTGSYACRTHEFR